MAGLRTLGRGGVRPSWIFHAAREWQLLAGMIAFHGAGPLKPREILSRCIPPVANDLERYVLEGMIALSDRAIERQVSRSAMADPGTDLAFHAKRILHNRYAEPWTIARLARALGTNRFRLTTEFKALVGVGVHEYLVQCRIDAARQLIGAGEKIEVAAHAVGFRSRKTLYLAFRRVLGTLPTVDR